jgi:hypothetical protein
LGWKGGPHNCANSKDGLRERKGGSRTIDLLDHHEHPLTDLQLPRKLQDGTKRFEVLVAGRLDRSRATPVRVVHILKSPRLRRLLLLRLGGVLLEPSLSFTFEIPSLSFTDFADVFECGGALRHHFEVSHKDAVVEIFFVCSKPHQMRAQACNCVLHLDGAMQRIFGQKWIASHIDIALEIVKPLLCRCFLSLGCSRCHRIHLLGLGGVLLGQDRECPVGIV